MRALLLAVYTSSLDHSPLVFRPGWHYFSHSACSSGSLDCYFHSPFACPVQVHPPDPPIARNCQNVLCTSTWWMCPFRDPRHQMVSPCGCERSLIHKPSQLNLFDRYGLVDWGSDSDVLDCRGRRCRRAAGAARVHLNARASTRPRNLSRHARQASLHPPRKRSGRAASRDPSARTPLAGGTGGVSAPLARRVSGWSAGEPPPRPTQGAWGS